MAITKSYLYQEYINQELLKEGFLLQWDLCLNHQNMLVALCLLPMYMYTENITNIILCLGTLVKDVKCKDD